MTLEFYGEAISWRGPAPFVFVPVPSDLSAEIKAISAVATYGWGVIPVIAQIGNTQFKTSLFPRGDIYLVPIKVHVQKEETLKVGDTVTVRLEIVIGS